MPSKMEDTTENEAMQTDQKSDESKESYQAQGARPKQPPAKKIDLLFIESFRPVVCQSGTVEISEHNGLIFTGHFQANLEAQDVRLASKFLYELREECIHLSFYNNEADCISNIFFKALNTSDTDECLARLQDFLKKRLQAHCGQSDDTLSHAMNVLNKQPIFMGWVRTTVQEKKGDEQVKFEAPPSDATEFLVIVDLECVSWYLKKMLNPAYQMTFWAEERPKSVETVKHHHGENFILFETEKLAIVMEAKHEIVVNLRILRPKKVNFMKDIEVFLDFVPQIERDTPFYLRNEQSGAYDSSRASFGASNDLDLQLVGEVQSLRGELDSALDQFKDSEDFQNMWMGQELDLQELITDGKVPKTDSSSGGLDPNNEEHFKKALMDISDQLKGGAFPTALSRVAAVREVFGESSNKDIRQFLRDYIDLEILKRLYFSSLVV